MTSHAPDPEYGSDPVEELTRVPSKPLDLGAIPGAENHDLLTICIVCEQRAAECTCRDDDQGA